MKIRKNDAGGSGSPARKGIFGNLHFKLLSLVLAGLVWLICINIVNPVITRNYVNRLTIRNLDVIEANGFVLLNEDELINQSVGISIRGASDIFRDVVNTQFQPYIDVSPIDYIADSAMVNEALPVNIRIERTGAAANTGFSPVSVEAQPSMAYIRLDRVTDVIKNIAVNITGSPADNYFAGAGYTAPEAVKITGPASVLNRIASVSASVDIDGALGNVYQTSPVVIVDIDGNDITDTLKIDRRTVEAAVPVDMFARIPVRYNIIGEPAFGFEVTAVAADTEFVDITGQEDDIKRAAFISLPDININGIRETTSYAVDVRPELAEMGLAPANGAQYEVTVTVIIVAHIERDLMLVINEPSTLIGLGEGLVLEPFMISLTVAGRSDVMQNFDTARDLSVALDITGLGAGRHSVPITISLPEGVYQKSEREPAVIEITEIETEEDEGEEEQEEEA